MMILRDCLQSGMQLLRTRQDLESISYLKCTNSHLDNAQERIAISWFRNIWTIKEISFIKDVAGKMGNFRVHAILLIQHVYRLSGFLQALKKAAIILRVAT